MSGPSIDETIELIKIAHLDQVDKGGQPYWTHPVRVAARLLLRAPDIDPDAVKAALLHDVIEDTSFDEITLSAHGFSPRVIWLVRQLARDKLDGLTYAQWIKKLAATRDFDLISIKLADNEDNADPDRLALLPMGVTALRAKYEASMVKLRGTLTQMRAKAIYEAGGL